MAAALAFAACAPRPVTSIPVDETPEQCEARKSGLVAFVREASARGIVSTTRVQLPESTLGAAAGSGHLLELSPAGDFPGSSPAGDFPGSSSGQVFLDGAALEEPTIDGRVSRFKSWVATFATGKDGAASGGVLYVAAERTLEIRALRTYLSHVPEGVELRLLVRSRTPTDAILSEEGSESARKLAKELWSEPDPVKRRELATAGYDAHGDCPALEAAVASVKQTEPSSRWPEVQAALLRSVPSCSCRQLDTGSLRLIAGAELRAGAASLAWIPLTFLRDPRCDASMPLRSVEKLVRQVEEFDVEFSGKIGEAETRFEDVLASDRLRVYFCDALPGELLAAKQRVKSAIHFRVPGLSACDTFAFEPLATGSPMGTLRRASSSSRPPLAFHYWQGAEEIRLFGPLDPNVKSLPTDARDYTCNETLRFQSVDEHSLALEGGGRWFMSAEVCAGSDPDAARTTGCVAGVAAGLASAP